MDFIDNRTKDIMQMSLDGLYERSKAISANTVNVLTPGYQRKTVSFEDSLRNVINRENEKEQARIQNSIEYQNNPKKVLQGITPEQLAFLNTDYDEGYQIEVGVDNSDAMGIDDNNVNLEEEMMDEAATGMKYQVLTSLMSKNYQILGQVIRGQNQ